MNKHIATALAATALLAAPAWAQDIEPAKDKADPANDTGPALAVEAQEKPSGLPISKSAQAQVSSFLLEHDFWMGYNEEKDAFIEIGTADAVISNPSATTDYWTIRVDKTREAYIAAKAQVVSAIEGTYSAFAVIETITGNSLKADFEKQNKSLLDALDAAKTALLKKLAALDKAEAEELRGIDLRQQSSRFIDAVIAKVDETYNRKGVEDELKERCESIKAEVEELKNTIAELQAQAEKAMPPTPTTEQKFGSRWMASMPIFGATVLTQAESWDEANGQYQTAVAVLWSRKLQDQAAALAMRKSLDTGRKGMKLSDWLKRQNLAAMCGPRKVVDEKGRLHFLGIASHELGTVIALQKPNREAAQRDARDFVLFSLFGDVAVYDETRRVMADYASEDNSINTKITERLDINRISQTISERSVSGVSQCWEDELEDPVTHKRVFVSVYELNPGLAAKALELQKSSYKSAAALDADAAYREGLVHGMQETRERVRNSEAIKNAGVREGAKTVGKAAEAEIKDKNEKATKPPKKPKGDEPTLEGDGQNHSGVYSGDADVDLFM